MINGTSDKETTKPYYQLLPTNSESFQYKTKQKTRIKVKNFGVLTFGNQKIEKLKILDFFWESGGQKFPSFFLEKEFCFFFGGDLLLLF